MDYIESILTVRRSMKLVYNYSLLSTDNLNWQRAILSLLNG